jgi:hypothetical protein
MPIENLPLSKIRADHRAQPRENLITDVVQSYAEAMPLMGGLPTARR